MDYDLQDQRLLALALALMRKGEYQLMEPPPPLAQSIFTDFFNRPLPQLWLLRNDGRNYSLVRLQVVDQEGPSAFSRDLRQVADHLGLFRKWLNAKYLNLAVIYLVHETLPSTATHQLASFAAIEEKRCTLDVGFISVQDIKTEQEPDKSGNPLPATVRNRAAIWTEFYDLVNHDTVDKLREKVEQEQKRQEEAFNRVFRYGRPILTTTFLILNVLFFFALEWVGSSTDPQTLIQYGAKWNPLIAEGEYWRLITPMFLHIGIWHILINSMALYFLGGTVERIYGSFRFFWIYFAAGIMGTVASFAFTPNLAAGASGAIFGCFGALLYFGLKRRNLFFRTMGMDVIFTLGFNLAFGFIMPMVDNYGHMGGLVGGFMAAAIVNLPGERRLKEQLTFTLAIALVFLFLLNYGLHRPLDSHLYHYVQAQIDMSEGNLDEALHHIHQAIEKGMESNEAYLQLGIIYNHKQQYEEAEKALNQALNKGGGQAELYFHLSYAQLMQKNYEEGIKNLQQAIARNPDMKEAYYNLALIYAEQKEYSYAVEVLERAFERGLRDEALEKLYQEIMKKRG